MFHSQTTLILGAGSSFEAGLPLGRDLAAKISQLVNFKIENGALATGSAEIYSAIRTKLERANEYRSAGVFIASAIQLADSIDDFLSLHQSDERINAVGKLGIVRAIVDAERHSALYPRYLNGQSTVDFRTINDTWFVKFLKILSRGVPKEKVDEIFDNVSFVNFNYDRCLEFFLWQGLQKLYGVSDRRAAEIVSRVRIFRPYGSIGPLKELSKESGVGFAADDVDYFQAAGRVSRPLKISGF